MSFLARLFAGCVRDVDPAARPPARAPASAPPSIAPSHELKPPRAPSTPAAEPYSASRAAALFAAYEDPDEPGAITADGFARLCEDAALPMDGALPLLVRPARPSAARHAR
jgi:hypothetical protein